MITDDIEKVLFENRDLKYRDFHSKLMPDYDKSKIIGVRMPEVRKIAKSFSENKDIDLFLKDLPHKYYEENNIHAAIVCEFNDYEKTAEYLNLFLPFVDNWATCDMIKPKTFKKNRELLRSDIDRWLASSHSFTVRFAIEMLMTYFLDDRFEEDYFNKVLKVKNEEYYVKMMKAWYFATALAKQWNSAVKVLENEELDVWTHNKTVQKAIESFRVTDEQKIYLRTLKK